jgi:Restriction endonuclease S subunits
MTRLPDSWARVAITEVLEPNNNGKPLQQGWSPQCERFPADSHTWGVLKTTAIQSGEFRDYENKSLPPHLEPRPHIEVEPGDLLMTCAGPRSRCGVICLVERTRPKLMISGKMYRFRPHCEAMNPKYLAYFVQTREAQLEIDRMKTGISDSGLNLTHDRFSALQVPVAPLEEQHRIVAKIEEMFSELNKGVESLKTAREQLRIYRQAVLKNAFEGKLTAKWREENRDNLEAGIEFLARIKDAQNARYKCAVDEWMTAAKAWAADGMGRKKPSKPEHLVLPPPLTTRDLESLPALPTGWLWTRLGELFSSSPQNGLYKPAGAYGNGTHIIRIDDFYDGKLIKQSGFKRLELEDNEAEKYKVDDGDIIINRVNSIEYLGKCALVYGLREETVFESNIMKCNIVENVSKRFYVFYLSSHDGRSRLCSNAKHAVNQASINQKDVANTPVPLPSFAEQIDIVGLIEKHLSQSDALIGEIDLTLSKAEALRQSILNKAFSGQLVAQDPGDEPASVLLERIRTEKAGRANGRKNNKRKEAA